jgi:hypothetical protein
MDATVAGSVLVDQTLVCEAARLLQGSNTRNAERLTQLSLLLDAILLYDRIYVLPSDLPEDASELGLRHALVDTEILADLDTRACEAAVTSELTAFLTSTGKARAANGRRADPAFVAAMVQAAVTGEPYSGEAFAGSVGRAAWSAGDVVRDARSGREGALLGEDATQAIHLYVNQSALLHAPDPVGTLGSHLMRLVLSGISGAAIPSAASHLRTFVYWRTSAHLDLPFYPSLRRLAQYDMIAGHARPTVQDAVYHAVAESFQATVNEVYQDDVPQPFYLPPALTLFLDHLRREHDTVSAVRWLRAEFAPLRRGLARLQEERAHATSLGELRVARARFADVLDQLRNPGPPESNAVLDQALDLAPALTSALTNPLDASSYANVLVKAPKDRIRRWWRRRPYRLAFRLRDRLLGVRHYADLFADATGVHVDPAEFTNLNQEFGNYLNRLPATGPARRPTG